MPRLGKTYATHRAMTVAIVIAALPMPAKARASEPDARDEETSAAVTRVKIAHADEALGVVLTQRADGGWRELCRLPCDASVDVGSTLRVVAGGGRKNFVVRSSWKGVSDLVVTTEHSPGYYVGGAFLVTGGFFAAVLGSLFLVIGSAFAGPNATADTTGMIVGGGLGLAGGTAMIVGGVSMLGNDALRVEPRDRLSTESRATRSAWTPLQLGFSF
ncbi:MAG: hypothetical protein KF819_16330 [Labilithrix sp.]|nr:hypothetical protein [Labilithrix sp.]